MRQLKKNNNRRLTMSDDKKARWILLKDGCPWRSDVHPPSTAGYCIAIVWQSGATRPCCVENCAPFFWADIYRSEHE